MLVEWARCVALFLARSQRPGRQSLSTRPPSEGPLWTAWCWAPRVRREGIEPPVPEGVWVTTRCPPWGLRRMEVAVVPQDGARGATSFSRCLCSCQGRYEWGRRCKATKAAYRNPHQHGRKESNSRTSVLETGPAPPPRPLGYSVVGAAGGEAAFGPCLRVWTSPRLPLRGGWATSRRLTYRASAARVWRSSVDRRR